MRIADRKTEIKVGQVEDLDEDALGELTATIARMSELNRSLWDFIIREGLS